MVYGGEGGERGERGVRSLEEVGLAQLDHLTRLGGKTGSEAIRLRK